MDTYTQKMVQHLGCYTDAASRVFSDKGSGNTVKACFDSCSGMNKGYIYMAMQNGDDCYCGKENVDYTRHGVSTACRGGKGGPWALSVYHMTY